MPKSVFISKEFDFEIKTFIKNDKTYYDIYDITLLLKYTKYHLKNYYFNKNKPNYMGELYYDNYISLDILKKIIRRKVFRGKSDLMILVEEIEEDIKNKLKQQINELKNNIKKQNVKMKYKDDEVKEDYNEEYEEHFVIIRNN